MITLAAWIIHCNELEAIEEQASTNSFRRTLSLEHRRRRDRRIPRHALLHPASSPWQRVLEYGNDQAMITRFDHASFNALHELFHPIFRTHSPYAEDGIIRQLRPESMFRPGRPRSLNSEACLGLILVYGRTTCYTFVLSALFGLTHTPVSMWLKFGRRVLLFCIKNHAAARVRMPTPEKVAEYKAMIRNLYPRLRHVYSVADGLKIRIDAAGDGMVQDMFAFSRPAT